LIINAEENIFVLDFKNFMGAAGTEVTTTVNTIALAVSEEAGAMDINQAQNRVIFYENTTKKLRVYNYLTSEFILEQDFSVPDNGEGEQVSVSSDGKYVVSSTEFEPGIKLLIKTTDPTPSSDGSNPSSPILNEDKFSEHRPSENSEYFSNPFSNISLRSLSIGTLIGAGVTGANSSACPNIGVALIKMFQLIEILGKFLFIPVVFKDLLLDGLNGINELGDVVTLPEDTFLGSVDEG
jgi:archaellin